VVRFDEGDFSKYFVDQMSSTIAHVDFPKIVDQESTQIFTVPEPTVFPAYYKDIDFHYFGLEVGILSYNFVFEVIDREK
jgi:hypothetical protein